jgi:hypothetical protein
MNTGLPPSAPAATSTHTTLHLHFFFKIRSKGLFNDEPKGHSKKNVNKIRTTLTQMCVCSMHTHTRAHTHARACARARAHTHSSEKLPYVTLVEEAVPKRLWQRLAPPSRSLWHSRRNKDLLLLLLLEGRDSCKSVPRKNILKKKPQRLKNDM